MPTRTTSRMSYNFEAEVEGRSWPEAGEKRISRRELRGRDTNNEREHEYETKVNANVNVIIRLVCISRYNGFKYRRFLEIQRGSGNRVRSSGGGAIIRT